MVSREWRPEASQTVESMVQPTVGTAPIDLSVPDQERYLVERHRYGDPDAFDELYSRFHGTVFNIARRMVGDADAAADVTQEVFLRAHRALGRFKCRSSLKTWICSITLNCCRTRLRRRYLRRQLIRQGAAEREPADPAPGPYRQALGRAVARDLELALSDLPTVFREAVVLRDIQNLDYAEIGTVLGVRPGTVRSRIARGREKLRSLMEAWSE